MTLDMATPAIRVAGVTHTYRKTVALDALSLDVSPGRLVGFIGPDGVGKSTLLSLIAGAKRLQTGGVDVLGGPMNSLSRHRVYAAGVGSKPICGTLRARKS